MDERLIIDWTLMPTYNTIMALAVGAGLCSLASMGKDMIQKQRINPEGWALNLGVLGVLLFTTGLHMTLTWPMAKYFPFDNIIFGEPSLGFGVILLMLSFYIWKKAEKIKILPEPLQEISQNLRHLKFILYGFGLALISISFAGIIFQLFSAPIEEPISGYFAEYPVFEAVFISLLYALVGVPALLMPAVLEEFALENAPKNSTLQKITYGTMMGIGTILLLFGAMNYFTHIGLIINTMP